MTLATYVTDDGSEKIEAMKEKIMRYLFLAQARQLRARIFFATELSEVGSSCCSCTAFISFTALSLADVPPYISHRRTARRPWCTSRPRTSPTINTLLDLINRR